MKNIFVKYPKRGDHVVGELATGRQLFIHKESFSLAGLDTAAYEIIGTVAYREGRKVLVVAKETEEHSLEWARHLIYAVTGYNLDGTDRTARLGYRESSAATENTELVLNYKASAIGELAGQIEKQLQAVPALKEQEFHCYTDGDGLKICYKYTFWQQYSYDTLEDGLSWSHVTMPDVAASSLMPKRNGNSGGEGALSNPARAVSYYRQDLESTTHNPVADLKDIKTAYPVCLPAFLGTSKHQSDHCKLLRDFYGEDEEGWLRYMDAQKPVFPTDRGELRDMDGRQRTAAMASCAGYDGSPLSPAAHYCINVSFVTMPAGSFWLPTPRELYRIIGKITWPTNPDISHDPLNESITAQGGRTISSTSSLWSCGRCGASSGWCAHGGFGFFAYYSMYGRLRCLPVSLLNIND